MNELLSQQTVAESLLWCIWRSIVDDYKSWDNFENAIRASSYVSSMKNFIQDIKKKLPLVINAQHTKEILSVIDADQDDHILHMLRSETTYLVMLVRLKNQERKELLKS